MRVTHLTTRSSATAPAPGTPALGPSAPQPLGSFFREGFTLIELLVVISIISILAAVAFPTLRTTLQSTTLNTAANQVNNGLSAARVYATRNKPFVAARPSGGGSKTSEDNGDGYSGSIALFAPDNTIRILENDENAYDPALTASNGWLELTVPPLNGYRPIADVEDLGIPSRVQVFGIIRTGNGNYDVRLVPPPFAIRFARDGTIAPGQDDNLLTTPGFSPSTPTWDRIVYVSPTGDPRTIAGKNKIVTTAYGVNQQRPTAPNSTYNSSRFGYNGTERMPDGRVQLPFGAIETVSGVLVVEPERVPESYTNPGGGTTTINFNRDRIDIYNTAESATLLNWANDNPTYGRILLFNRYTGQDLTR